MRAFFDSYIQIRTETVYDDASIYNMDDSGFSNVPTHTGKVLAEKGSRHVGIMSAQERGTLVTLALTVNAAGNFLPPFFIFPTKNMQSVFMDNKSAGAVGYANGSGWMKQSEFAKFMEHFIQHSGASMTAPKLLLMDNHTSHMSIEALDLAIDNGVTMKPSYGKRSNQGVFNSQNRRKKSKSVLS